MSLVELVLTTSLSAFFASLAAVVVSMIISRRQEGAGARQGVLQALARHQSRVWGDPARRTSGGAGFLDNPNDALPCLNLGNAQASMTVTEVLSFSPMLPEKQRELVGVIADKLRGISKDAPVEQEINIVETIAFHLVRSEWTSIEPA